MARDRTVTRLASLQNHTSNIVENPSIVFQ